MGVKYTKKVFFQLYVTERSTVFRNYVYKFTMTW